MSDCNRKAEEMSECGLVHLQSWDLEGHCSSTLLNRSRGADYERRSRLRLIR